MDTTLTRQREIAKVLPHLWQDQRLRRLVLAGMGAMAGVGATVAGYALFHEPFNVQFDRITIQLPNGDGHLPEDGLRILHLSDSHFRGRNRRERAKIESIRRHTERLDYDILVHTGDFLHDDHGLDNVAALLDALPKPRLAGYAVLGNHDYTRYSHKGLLGRTWENFQELDVIHRQALGRPSVPSRGDRLLHLLRFGAYFMDAPMDMRRTGQNDVGKLEAILCQRGITVLHNRSTTLRNADGQPGGVDVVVAGVDDLTEGAPNLFTALAEADPRTPTILLSHNPDILDEPGLEHVDLLLAGHTHGGQIVLPLLGPAHTQSTYLKRNEVSGYLRRGATQVYITRGIGEGIPLRFGAHPQITLITLVAAPPR